MVRTEDKQVTHYPRNGVTFMKAHCGGHSISSALNPDSVTCEKCREIMGWGDSTLTRQQARAYAARIHRELAAEAMTADYYADHVTESDRADIAMKKLRLAEEIERGEHDHNFAVAQRMHYFLTGESVPFLPPRESQ